jgi:hypothetical protein
MNEPPPRRDLEDRTSAGAGGSKSQAPNPK